MALILFESGDMMAEVLTLSVFSFVLIFCIANKISVFIALFAGLILFAIYALCQKFSLREVMVMMLAGVKEARIILIVFTLIGMLTALWRAGGTVPFIIYYTVSAIDPRFFILFSFLLCSLVSFLTGTAFGTVSTMGIICMMTGKALGIQDFYLGGAILSGVFFGDRCSPMSSSALLVSELTGTNINRNVANMMKTAIIPFIFAVIFYAAKGSFDGSSKITAEKLSFLAQTFNLTPVVLLPAAVILLFTMMRFNIKVTILCSIITSVLVCIFCQKVSGYELIRYMLMGYRSVNPGLGQLINGGGIISMFNTMLIIVISSSYFGIFRKTNLLNKIKRWSFALAQCSTDFAAVLVVSVITVALSCNQTLATMLTYEITEGMFKDREKLAVFLANSVIVISALIPWSIASVFPLTTIGAPRSSIFYAVYLYALPLWSLFVSYVDCQRFKSLKNLIKALKV
ncbi:Na+:H+ antiporter, NhaC family [Caldanaerovirga acetigignens]|uniref:Na+:H+ antiporter, NhaC family n=1 Tax=Caldanaerovirga acetigignens TaxID=447595 RepID=A0A1M7HG74_9FIRM|nr:Na+/H+ antiporter NhaC family protein [Caldanaerovirga acetigignens]SHM27454.1 Na+:H+ antiporter, NhaC family [Caldanaerovirga acetigignens]